MAASSWRWKRVAISSAAWPSFSALSVSPCGLALYAEQFGALRRLGHPGQVTFGPCQPAGGRREGTLERVVQGELDCDMGRSGRMVRAHVRLVGTLERREGQLEVTEPPARE